VIARLMRTGSTIFVYVCLATIMAEVVLGGYVVAAWKLDKNRLIQILAIAQGIDLFEMKENAEREMQDRSTEQVSIDQILEVRAGKFRNLELREQALRNDLSQLAFEQQKLSKEETRYRQLRESFNTELATLQQRAASAGMDDNRSKLETIHPKQAKQLLDEMLDAEEIDDVVILLSGMPNVKSAKIIKEFSSEQDVKRIGEVLRRIRQGAPTTALAAEAQNRLNPSDASEL